jgi:hypothetical protein
VHPTTGISWLDQDITGLRSCHLICPEARVRQRLLARATASSVDDSNVLLLTFLNQHDNYWSFNISSFLNKCQEYTPLPKLKDNLAIHRASPLGNPLDTDWSNIQRSKYGTIIAHMPSNLQEFQRSRYSLIDDVAQKIEDIADGSSLVLLDREIAVPALIELMDTTIKIDWDNGPVKHILKHPSRQGMQQRVSIGSGQRTINDFSQPVLY